jgi:hypothetical protein
MAYIQELKNAAGEVTGYRVRRRQGGAAWSLSARASTASPRNRVQWIEI